MIKLRCYPCDGLTFPRQKHLNTKISTFNSFKLHFANCYGLIWSKLSYNFWVGNFKISNSNIYFREIIVPTKILIKSLITISERRALPSIPSFSFGNLEITNKSGRVLKLDFYQYSSYNLSPNKQQQYGATSALLLLLPKPSSSSISNNYNNKNINNQWLAVAELFSIETCQFW